MSARSSLFRVALLCTGTLFSVQSTSAQVVEIGAFGQSTRFDDAMGFDNAIGGGGHLTFFFLKSLGLEADVGFGSSNHAPTAASSSQLSARARLLIAPQSGAVGLLFGAGAVYNKYGYNSAAWESGVTGLLGLQVRLGNALRLRLAGISDYMPSTSLPTAQTSNLHLGAQLGFSVRLASGGGGGAQRVAEDPEPAAPTDADRDGVRDGMDRCAGTPVGATVDAMGCPVPFPDSDGDGVPNADDQCAGTPAGTAVDANGCGPPISDVDVDGVPDTVDQCPNTPVGAAVGANGCALPPPDTDGDGVPDGVDQCANTAAGVAVGSNGCALPPPDSDGDGVPDTRDQCTGTPAGTPVGANGCALPPAPPADDDGDGVPDSADRCPNTRAGADVDAVGCPVPPPAAPAPPADGDGDGIPDVSDRCLNTIAGAVVDANGCTVTPAVPARVEPVVPAGSAEAAVIAGLRFVRNSDGITFPVEPILNRLADSLNAMPTGRWEIGVHTDEGGSAESSLDLSQRRANEIRNYLIGRGMSPDRLVALGYGRTEMEGRARRVELRAIN